MRNLLGSALVVTVALLATAATRPTAEAASAPAQQSAQLLPGQADAAFAVTAAQDGIAEVAMGRLALQRAVDPRVRAFAERMVGDHSSANQELAAVAATNGMTLPTEPGFLHAQLFEHLNGLQGPAFDRAYVQFQLEAHHRAVELFEREIATGQDADLQGFATATLPTLREHLRAVQGLYAQLGTEP